MESNEIRSRFLKFFEARGHKIIPSSSLIPENDPSVLFTTAGMQQFKQYYTHPKDAEKDFGSLNVASVQKCIRTGDIDEVGDSTHLTFFEMLGNFSFGGYGRREAIQYAYDFIVKELGLEISYVTVYKGSKNVPKDDESEKIWKEIGIKNIKEEGEDVFWGPTGESGPCGPTTEIYCKNANGEDVEIWNIVFNEYFCDGSREKLDKGEINLKKLPILGVDTGMGFERLVSIVQKKGNVYDTDLFLQIIKNINFLRKYHGFGSGFDMYSHESDRNYHQTVKAVRVIADHIRSAIFMIGDGITPSKEDRNYVLRKLLRRAIRYSHLLTMDNNYTQLYESVSKQYDGFYPEIHDKKEVIILELEMEFKKFIKTLENGLKIIKDLFKKENNLNTFALNDDKLFDLYQTDGFPVELSLEEINRERGNRGLLPMDDNLVKEYLERFNKKMAEHQELSRTASAGMFKGGLVEEGEETKKLHTATHLLNAALRQVLGNHIMQKGSNITAERLRFDFSHSQKMTEEEKKRVEEIVNDKIAEKLPVGFVEMPKAEAEKIAAHSFNEKYGDMVKVYSIGNEEKGYFSREFCGGPHVKNTSELASVFDPEGNPKSGFKIQKEEAVSAGVRRIKAVLL
jgi:alanyl-tRNA synthetase